MRSCLLLLVCAFAACLPAVARAQDADAALETTYRTLLARHGEAVVPVRFVTVLNFGGQEQRNEDRTQGMLVSADGLVLVPDRAVSVDYAALAGQSTNPGAMLSSRSSDFQVLIGDSDDWRTADLVTRDSELGLAWLRIRGAQGLPFLDLREGTEPRPGMRFYSLLRASEDWGGVPVFRPGLILGETRSPSWILIVDGAPGMAFDAAGLPIGYVDFDLAKLARSRSAGMGLDLGNAFLRMVPLAKVLQATEQAARLPMADPEP
jgi:hypothetical protein